MGALQVSAIPFQPAPGEVVLHAPSHGGWLYFHRPLGVVVARRLEEIVPALQEVEQQVERRGRYAAGFLSYEAAPAFDPAFRVKDGGTAELPLLWFAIYPPPSALPAGAFDAGGQLLLGPWLPDVTGDEYRRAIQQVKAHIARGETYQVNYTYRLQAACQEPAWPLFAALAGPNPTPYAAFLETEAWALCSISPEQFFSLDGETLTSRPMKGTAPRGLTQENDQQLANWLYHSEKNRAENVMIVDMVRNDMGRIARTGSVHVPALFSIEKYATVWQMTSTVRAATAAGFSEILQALFPAASITGAPKIRTMQIICALERSPRRIYTGAIGFFGPGRRAQFNVAIRTLRIDKVRAEAEYGVGGGIVWDSSPEEEWEETLSKARILHERPRTFGAARERPFELLETIRWTPDEGWFLLDRHLSRLGGSADYFSFSFDPLALQEELASLERSFQGVPQRVRLLLAEDGRITLEHHPLAGGTAAPRLTIARTPVDAKDRFLYHKTTRREVYEKALAGCPGYDDVLLWNERGELTESTIANLVVEMDGQLYTPPVEAGLLPGTYRSLLLEQGRVTERTVPLMALKSCERIYLVNSVRGMWEIKVDWGGLDSGVLNQYTGSVSPSTKIS